MANLVKKIRTSSGDLQIDYNALANLPTINNNILINGDFKINQRGATSYIQTNTWKYSVDRWRYIGLMNVTVNDSGTVTISKNNNNNQTYFAQALEDVYTSGSFVLSFCVKSIRGTMTAYIDSGGGSTLTVTSAGTYSISAPSGARAVVFRLDGSTTSVELSWAKLEHGTVATPFTPRLRGEELVLCQRYYQYYDTIDVAANGVYENMKYFSGFIFPTKMRAVPTISARYENAGNAISGVLYHAYDYGIGDFHHANTSLSGLAVKLLNIDAEIY